MSLHLAVNTPEPVFEQQERGVDALTNVLRVVSKASCRVGRLEPWWNTKRGKVMLRGSPTASPTRDSADCSCVKSIKRRSRGA